MKTNYHPLPTRPDSSPPQQHGLYLDEETAVILAEGVASILSHMWRDEKRMYAAIPTDDRPGHVFEQMMRVKAIINNMRHDLNAGLPLLGTCPHCQGYDGNYVIDGHWWGFCQLCEVRWYIDEIDLVGTIWPVQRGRWAQAMHNEYQPVQGVFGVPDEI